MKTVLSLLTALLFFVGMSVAQSTGTQSGTAADQAGTGTAQSQNQTGTAATGQTATPDQNATSDQNATQTTTTKTTTTRRHHHGAAAADQNADQTGAAANGANDNGKLPQTASPLPLLGLLGMGSLGLGAAARRKRK